MDTTIQHFEASKIKLVLALLTEYEFCTPKEIKGCLNVSKATFHRLIRALRLSFGVVIACDRNPGSDSTYTIIDYGIFSRKEIERRIKDGTY
jgi:predicted transcriptional regulator